MKKILAAALAALMLLSSCGAPADVTEAPDAVTDAPETNAPVTSAPETDAPVTEAPETEPPVKRENYNIQVSEDTYAYKAAGAKYVDDNFGSATDLQMKSETSAPIRYTYLKFDISSLVGDTDFTAIDLNLMLKNKQNDPGNPDYAGVEVYGASLDWNENTLTYNHQPEHYELITSRDDIAGNGKTFDFAVGSYIKHALEQGQTQVAFYLKERTTQQALHLWFESKESAKQGPFLTVHYGTKVDDSVYGGKIGAEPELSENGLDSLLGINRLDSVRITAIEDTYIQSGTTSDTNFGDSEMIDFKAYPGKENNYYRISLVKFDISDIKNATYDKIYLHLDCYMMEDEKYPTTLNVYSCFPDEWSEMTVTYNTRPERDELVTSMVVTAKGTLRLDVTDYVKKYSELGFKQISFYLEGDSGSVRRLNFHSKESAIGAPMLVLTVGNYNFSTYTSYTGENPWEVAMEYVSDWMHRWEVIKQGGDNSIKQVTPIDSEYALTVGAATAGNTKGEKTVYVDYPTRLVSTLKGYTASTAETAKYDMYGGLMDESMKQEATGFFYTTKIGDRWWTIDPLGYPFFRTAIVTITRGSTNQQAVVKAKYGTNSAWAQATTDRLHELGFNSTGGWSDITNLSQANNPLTQTQIIYVAKKYCQANGIDVSEGGNTHLLYDVIPVFDPAFETEAYKLIKSTVEKYATSSNIYGWMSDNELPDSTSMLDSALYLNSEDVRFAYTYATAWTFMYMKTGKLDVSVADITPELRLEYRAMVYDRYFKIVAEALDRYAPYHQFMGCRFLKGCYSDEYVMRVAGYWCDVVTANYYGAWNADFELLANQANWAGKPVVITEWYAKGMDVWEKDNRMTNESGAGWTVKNQTARGQFYQTFALSLMETKACVGFDWFLYWDNDPENLAADLSNRNSNKGVIDNNGNEYTELTKFMKELNDQKYNIINFFDQR